MIALLFAGHGAEHPGMGGDLVAADPGLVELASEQGDFDGVALLRRGGPRLHRTAVVQPLLTAVNLTIVRALTARGLCWSLCVGHSLGELAAWSAAGGLAAEAAVVLAARRGRLLAELAHDSVGAMLSVRIEDAAIDDLLAHGNARGIVDAAVHNAPGQWVVAGEREALAAIAGRFGGKFVANEGAWHSRLMEAGAGLFRVALGEVAVRPHEHGILANQHGGLVSPGQDFIEPFLAQLTGAVRWAACMRTLGELEVSEAVLIGPGKMLAATLRENLGPRVESGALRIHRVECQRDLDRVMQVLG